MCRSSRLYLEIMNFPPRPFQINVLLIGDHQVIHSLHSKLSNVSLLLLNYLISPRLRVELYLILHRNSLHIKLPIDYLPAQLSIGLILAVRKECLPLGTVLSCDLSSTSVQDFKHLNIQLKGYPLAVVEDLHVWVMWFRRVDCK